MPVSTPWYNTYGLKSRATHNRWLLAGMLLAATLAGTVAYALLLGNFTAVPAPLFQVATNDSGTAFYRIGVE